MPPPEPVELEREVEVQKIRVDAWAGDGICSKCKRMLDDDEMRLSMEMVDNETLERFEILICRPCLGEHMPDLLETIEAEVEASG